MNRRQFLTAAGGAAAATVLGRRAHGAEARRPNVVLFYFDDLDFDEIGVYDHNAFPSYTGARERGLFKDNMNPWLAYLDSPVVHTPHIDSLARDGARFDRFYITSSICTPSRYALLTGRYAGHAPALSQLFPPGTEANLLQNTELLPEEWSLPKLLKRSGYATGMVGKWHNSPWDGPYAGRVKGIAPDADPRDPEVARKIRAAYEKGAAYVRESHGFDYAGRLYLQNKEALGIPKALQVHNLEWLVEGALEFIDGHHEDPFFLYFASTAPHGWVGSGDFLNADPLATPAGMLEAPPKGMPPREDTARRAREAGAQARLIEATWLDDAVGSVLGRLEELDLTKNTLVFFISDHQNRGKRTCYEANHVPALLRWPGRARAGSKIGKLCANIDVLPTVLDACRVNPPADLKVDGRSLVPLLAGSGEAPWRDALLLEVAYAKAVVTEGWKYIALRCPEAVRAEMAAAPPNTYAWDGTATRCKQDTRWDKKGDVYTHYGAHKDFPAYFEADQLYHLDEDPYEQHNLAGDPAQADRLKKMQGLLKGLLAQSPHAFGEFTPGRAQEGNHV